MFAKIDKCEFSVEKIEFLGYVMSQNGLEMDRSKIAVIESWPTPRNVRDVQSFLGFANFYRRFIPTYSDLTVHLTRTTRKDRPWSWSPECENSFREIKAAFGSAPLLHHFDPSLPPIIETDASDYAIAAVFSVQTPDGEVHPVAFISRTLNGAELNYDTHNKELLSIHEAFKKWRHYCESPHHTIRVITDHKNLEYFSSTKVLTRRQARWSEYLSAFNMQIHFRPGKLGEKPDSLTRRPDFYLKRGDRDYLLANPQNLKPIFDSTQLVESLRATHLLPLALRATTLDALETPVLDLEAIIDDIREGLKHDPVAIKELALIAKGRTSKRFSLHDTGLLLMDDKILCSRLPSRTRQHSNKSPPIETRSPHFRPLRRNQDYLPHSTRLLLANRYPRC